MKVGDKLYKVNRDDRGSNFEDHNFIVLELNAHIRLRNDDLICFGDVRGQSFDAAEILKRMVQNNEYVIHLRNRNSLDAWGVILVRAESLEDAATKISEQTQNVYVQKEDARVELKELVTMHLTEMKRREASLQETIAQLSNTLNEL